MTLERPTFEFALQHAEAFKEIGETKVYLDRDSELPWEIAEHCEPGGSHRMDIATSVRFIGKHPSGLTFHWMFDIETADANGSSEYKINTAAIVAAIQKMREPVATEFRTYLKECAEKVEKRGAEYLASAQRQYGTAAALEALAEGK
jgi:hypothetical protein